MVIAYSALTFFLFSKLIFQTLGSWHSAERLEFLDGLLIGVNKSLGLVEHFRLGGSQGTRARSSGDSQSVDVGGSAVGRWDIISVL